MNKWMVIILGGCLVVGGMSACSPQDSSEQKLPQVFDPESLYLNHCANCHGGNLEGSYGPSLKQTGSKYSKDEILQIIQKGKGKMPSQAYVDPEEQEKLAEWLSKQK
ncbi:c-type cytochrome [Hazenella coriacea]|uniref:Cytochrome c551 n=1 Tax=Hazenella coriacea TaxID=1179467 RepID=A0A4R3L2X5_9BACL|nr:cytochrome c [Hazenella coriacea]TCS93829.1 cytochrome c551 [Hazenella coriacea]